MLPQHAGSGVTSLAVHLAARAHGGNGGDTPRLAWLDPHDRWDPAAAETAGISLDSVLWLRGCAPLAGLAGLSRWNQILLTLLQSGSLALVVVDFLDWPVDELRRMPRSAWFRLLRALERWRRTALVVLAPEAITQGCAAFTIGVSCEEGKTGNGRQEAGKVRTQLEVRIQARVLRSRDAPRLGPQSDSRSHPAMDWALHWRLRA